MRLIFEGEVIPLMDLKLALEYREVALRPHHLAASCLKRAEVLELIEAVESFSETVAVWVRTRPMSSDPNDDMVLHLAISGQAEALVTHNTKHFQAVGERFGITVVSPSEFLERRHRGENGHRN